MILYSFCSLTYRTKTSITFFLRYNSIHIQFHVDRLLKWWYFIYKISSKTCSLMRIYLFLIIEKDVNFLKQLSYSNDPCFSNKDKATYIHIFSQNFIFKQIKNVSQFIKTCRLVANWITNKWFYVTEVFRTDRRQYLWHLTWRWNFAYNPNPNMPLQVQKKLSKTTSDNSH